MVAQIFTDATQLVTDLDAGRLEHVQLTDAGQFEHWGELIEPALTTTSRLAWASYCCPLSV